MGNGGWEEQSPHLPCVPLPVGEVAPIGDGEGNTFSCGEGGPRSGFPEASEAELWGFTIAVDEEIIPYIALPFARILYSSPNNANANPFFSAHAAGAITFALVGKSNQKRRKRTASS